jgi:hypothetical protein
MTDSAPPDAVAKSSRVMVGRVTKKKTPVSKADVLKAPSRVGAGSVSNKKGAAAPQKPVVSKKDSTTPPKAAAPRKKDSAALSKAANAVEEPPRTVARGSKNKPDGGEVRLRKYDFTFHRVARLTRHDRLRTQAPQAYAVILERAMEQRSGIPAVPSLS